MLRLREWGCGPGSGELEAEAQSPTDSAVDESPGTAGATATAEPQAAADDVEDESAEADEAEDPADEPEDESAEAGEAEVPADGLEDESAVAAAAKNYAKALEDQFSAEGDWFGTGEGDDPANVFKEQLLVLQREQAEWDARMEKRMREDKSISLVLLNGSLSRLERRDVPEILEIRDQLSVVEEDAELEMGGFGVWNPSPRFLQRLRFSVEQRDPSHIADILRAGLDRECLTLEGSASGPRPVPTSYAEAVATLMASADSDADLYRKENWKAVQEWLQKDLIDPVTKEAKETPNALRRNQLVLAAGLISLAHTQLLSLTIAAAAPGGSHGPTGPRGYPTRN